MMKTFLISLCTILCCQQAIAQERYNQAVTVFNNFKAAVVKKDSTAALKYVDETTLDWVGDIGKMATTISKDELSSSPILVQYMILSVRHFTQGKDLRKINNRELFAILIQKGVLVNFIDRLQPATPEVQAEGELKIPFLLDAASEGMYAWVIAPNAPVLVDFRTILSNCDQLLTVDHEVSEKPTGAYLEVLFKKNFNENIKPTDWEPAK